MEGWFVSELSSSTSEEELSMADDCESIKSKISDSNNQEITYGIINNIDMPIFTKASGEAILILTNLYLPLKRSRDELEYIHKDFKAIRKKRNFKYQLQEFYEELRDMKDCLVTDNLLSKDRNYFINCLRKIRKIVDDQEINKKSDNENYKKIQMVKLIDLENYFDKKPRKKSVTRDFIFNYMPVQKNKLLNIKENDNEKYIVPMFSMMLPRLINPNSKISFNFFPKRLGKMKLQPGNNTNPYKVNGNLYWGENLGRIKKNYFSVLQTEKFLKFSNKNPFDKIYKVKLPNVNQ